MSATTSRPRITWSWPPIKPRIIPAQSPSRWAAIVGGGSEEEIEALRSYGLDTGLAFQIQDDLLNLIGAEESTKKDFRNDITEGKRTLVVVHALQHSSERERLIEILSSKKKDPAVLAEAVRSWRMRAPSITRALTRRASRRLPRSAWPMGSGLRHRAICLSRWRTGL